MKNKFLVLLVMGMALCSCARKANSAIQTYCCDEIKWLGSVSVENAPANKNFYYLEGREVIENGVFSATQQFSNSYRFWTALKINIPCCKQMNGDHMKVEWKAKSDMSISDRESDLGAWVFGSKDTVFINCPSEDRPEYELFYFGKTKLNEVHELANSPENWAVYTIEIYNNTLSFRKDGKLVKQLSAKESIGLLNQISLNFKGSGKIEWVKLYEAGKLAMQSDFASKQKPGINWMK